MSTVEIHFENRRAGKGLSGSMRPEPTYGFETYLEESRRIR